ncbi:MAG: DEAD/DEAH box helicase [Nitrososphaeraceae archaeon]
MNKYRCPECNSMDSIENNRIFDGRILFNCIKCKICGIIPLIDNIDETYLEFLDYYDDGKLKKIEDLEILFEEEKIIRNTKEINDIIKINHIENNSILKNTMLSKRDYIVDFKKIENTDRKFGIKLDDLPLNDKLIEITKNNNIKKIYKFQEKAIYKILKGKDIIIIAPTASGKTEAFALPILNKIIEEKYISGKLDNNYKKNDLIKINIIKSQNTTFGMTVAIFVYPTKSLARDQYIKLSKLSNSLNIKIGLFDGDTNQKDKDELYINPPDIIITNFDIIHFHLFNRTKLYYILKNIKYLVVDEVHVYRGIFGTNVHYVVKRLQRITNKKIQIIGCSATLPHAKEFCFSLFERNFEIVSGNGRKGIINFVMIYPALRSNRSLIIDLIKKTTKNKSKTLIFSNSHQSAELIAFNSYKNGLKIGVHRAGLLPKTRKIIENSFINGKITALSATPTLELGIDIGGIDTVISNIVPINRLVQRIGRASRRGNEGYAFLALGNDPISQYYKFHPKDYFDDEEIPFIDPQNYVVQENQILAMACDREISMKEAKPIWDLIQKLCKQDMLYMENNKFLPTKKTKERLKKYNIRGIGENVNIIFNDKIIGSRNLPQALEELHDQAIYFIAGKRYIVQKLVIDSKSHKYSSFLKNVSNNYKYYTKAIVNENPEILKVLEKRKYYGIELKYCLLKIQKIVSGYVNIEIGKEVNKGIKKFFDNPIMYEYVTKGFVFKVPKPIKNLENSKNKEYLEVSGYHATEHVIIEGSSMITGGSSQDLGGISLGNTGIIVIHDSSIGGNGASRSLFERFEKAIIRALTIVNECPCKNEDGCPRCTYSYRCGNNNEFLHKNAAIEVLTKIKNYQKTTLDDIDKTYNSLI